MAQDTLLGFPAYTLPYRCGGFTTLSTVSNKGRKAALIFLFIITFVGGITAISNYIKTHPTKGNLPHAWFGFPHNCRRQSHLSEAHT